jgi:hypothetical protein
VRKSVAEPTQGFITLLRGLGGGRLGEHVCQGPEPHAFGSLFVKLFGAREHGEHVHDVVLGVIVDGHALIAQRLLY